jgi:hypothetical protein
MGMTVPVNEQSATDLNPRHSLQIRLQKELRYLLTVVLSGSHTITGSAALLLQHH